MQAKGYTKPFSHLLSSRQLWGLEQPLILHATFLRSLLLLCELRIGYIYNYYPSTIIMLKRNNPTTPTARAFPRGLDHLGADRPVLPSAHSTFSHSDKTPCPLGLCPIPHLSSPLLSLSLPIPDLFSSKSILYHVRIRDHQPKTHVQKRSHSKPKPDKFRYLVIVTFSAYS